jgi:predicted transcriptional regulator
MMGSLVPSRSFACLGLLLSAYGITCLDFSLFVLDFVHMESPLSLKTLA